MLSVFIRWYLSWGKEKVDWVKRKMVYIEKKKKPRRFDNRQILFNILFSRGVFFIFYVITFEKVARVIIE